MARLREDPRFRAVQPDAFDTDGTAGEMPPIAPVRDATEVPEGGEMGAEEDEGLELWFDWAFVDFWKNHYCQSEPRLRRHRLMIRYHPEKYCD
jgi:hypothetical protein